MLFNLLVGSALHTIIVRFFRGVEDVAPYKKSKSIPRFLSIGSKKHFRVWFQTTFVGADVLDGPLFKQLPTQGSLV